MRYEQLIVLCALIMMGCNPNSQRYDIWGMIDGQSPHVNQRFDASIAWQEGRGGMVRTAQADEYNVYIASDTHVAGDTRCLSAFVSAYRADATCPVAIHLGDHIEAQGHWDELREVYSEVVTTQTKQDTLFTIVGNHDLYFGQWSEYTSLFHSSTCCFVVRTPSGARDLFILLDTGEGILGENQKRWLDDVLSAADNEAYRYCVVCMHVPLVAWSSAMNWGAVPIEEQNEWIETMSSHGVTLCVSGHGHQYETAQIGGVMYLSAPALKGETAEYMILYMGKETITPRLSIK